MYNMTGRRRVHCCFRHNDYTHSVNDVSPSSTMYHVCLGLICFTAHFPVVCMPAAACVLCVLFRTVNMGGQIEVHNTLIGFCACFPACSNKHLDTHNKLFFSLFVCHVWQTTG